MLSIRGCSCCYQGECSASTDVLSRLAFGLKSERENSLPFRRGSPCCDLFEGPDNRQLLEGYSARRRQEAFTDFPFTLVPRSFLKNNSRSVKRERKGQTYPSDREAPVATYSKVRTIGNFSRVTLPVVVRKLLTSPFSLELRSVDSVEYE